jgi:glycosyltransferase involved in cell wall biosynthesis
LLIIDGGSSDGTLEIVRSNSAHIAYWETGPDRSLYHAFNKALTHAKGDWLYFLGSDDYLWDGKVLESLAPYLSKAYPPTRIVYGRAAFVAANGEVLEFLGEPWGKFRRKFFQGRMIPHQGTLHHRSLFEAHGPFDDSFRVGGDYEMLLREFKHGNPIFVPDIIVAGYQFGGGSSRPENSINVLRAIRVAQRKHGLRFPGTLWIGAWIKVRLRQFLWRIVGEIRAKRILDAGRALIGRKPFWTRL